MTAKHYLTNRRTHPTSRTHTDTRRKRSCPSGKVRFPDHKAAVRALHDAVTARKFAALDNVPTQRREQRAYACGRCRGYHLTSQLKAGHPSH